MISLILEGLADERQAKTEQCNMYMNYIKTHKSNVVKAYDTYFQPLLKDLTDGELKEAIIKAGFNIVNHDLSKYEPIEFEAYRQHWYPTDFEKADKGFKKRLKPLYDAAWEHHHRHNGHHPEHWAEDGNKQDMPLEYIIEMFCDWIAMDMFYKSSTREWWESKKTQSNEATYMTQETLKWVNYILYDLLPDLSFKEEK